MSLRIAALPREQWNETIHFSCYKILFETKLKVKQTLEREPGLAGVVSGGWSPVELAGWIASPEMLETVLGCCGFCRLDITVDGGG